LSTSSALVQIMQKMLQQNIAQRKCCLSVDMVLSVFFSIIQGIDNSFKVLLGAHKLNHRTDWKEITFSQILQFGETIERIFHNLGDYATLCKENYENSHSSAFEKQMTFFNCIAFLTENSETQKFFPRIL
jgi:hypothetical protein